MGFIFIRKPSSFYSTKERKMRILDRSRFAPKSCVCKVFDILRAKNISAQGRRKLWKSEWVGGISNLIEGEAFPFANTYICLNLEVRRPLLFPKGLQLIQVWSCPISGIFGQAKDMSYWSQFLWKPTAWWMYCENKTIVQKKVQLGKSKQKVRSNIHI